MRLLRVRHGKEACHEGLAPALRNIFYRYWSRRACGEQARSQLHFLRLRNHVATPRRWAKGIGQQHLRLVREDVAPLTCEKILGLHLRNFHWIFCSR